KGLAGAGVLDETSHRGGLERDLCLQRRFRDDVLKVLTPKRRDGREPWHRGRFKKSATIFPVPWTATADTSTLLTESELLESIKDAGFTLHCFDDAKQRALGYAGQQQFANAPTLKRQSCWDATALKCCVKFMPSGTMDACP